MNRNNILIIDDEQSIRFTLKELLEIEDYKVDTCEDAFEAIEMVKKEDYAVIITDIMMPQIKGSELAFSLKALSKNSKIIIMTGYPTEETKELGKKAGAYAYLEKPITKNNLIAVIKKALGQ